MKLFEFDAATRAVFAGRRRQLSGILALMIVSALSEGAGLMLFVPMLAALGGSAVRSPRFVELLTAIHVPATIGPLLLLFVALALGRAAVNFARDTAQFRFHAGVIDDLRSRAWSALVRCDWRTLAGMRRSEGTGLLLTEVERIGFGIQQMFFAAGSLITLAGLGLAALLIAPVIAISALLIGGAALAVYRRIQRRTRRLGEQFTDAQRLVRAEFDEGLGALRVIKSFGCEDRAIASGGAAASALRRIEWTFYRTVGTGSIAIQGGGAAVLAALVWIAVTRWGAGAELILPLVALSLRAMPLLPVLHHCWQGWVYAKPTVIHALALIETAEAAREPEPTGRPLPPLRREVALRGVTVRYAGRDHDALARVDLVLPARGITALVGASGAGKSTVADVLGGLLTVDGGALEVDGTPLEGSALRDWRRQVTYVQQDPWLFPGTIRANLLWADPDANEARLHDALRLAAANFVAVLPDGLDTRLGDNGRALSGGERQRIVLARALLRDPQLLILDEATSALDNATEAAIAEAVIALRERMTILIIGHRGRLTALADRTFRIDDGRIEQVLKGPAQTPIH